MENSYNIYGKKLADDGPCLDMDKALPFVHYSNPYYREQRTVWGAPDASLFYNYSDRLWEANRDKAEEASKQAGLTQVCSPATPRQIQQYLSLYHGSPVTLRHIMAGINRRDGFSYLVFGYTY